MDMAKEFPEVREEWMLRGLYYSGQQQQRFLTVDEIATACRVSPGKVKELIAMKVLRPAATEETMVDVGQVLWFLLSNSMPVAASLLPPKTGKILFLAGSVAELYEKEETFDHICKLFANDRNLVLAESATLGRKAHLTILTFDPDVVVVFQRLFSKSLAATCDLLAGMPRLKTILVVDRATKLAVDNGLLAIPADLVVAETQSIEQLTTVLRTFFRN